jgi:hypothetical protein
MTSAVTTKSGKGLSYGVVSELATGRLSRKVL